MLTSVIKEGGSNQMYAYFIEGFKNIKKVQTGVTKYISFKSSSSQ